MGKSLSVEIRNTDFGPVKNGKFFDAQIKGTQEFGIGDGLFVPPRSFDSKRQYGYEELAKPIFTVVYKDGKTSEVKADAKQFPTLGEASVINVPLLDNKNYQDILSLSLRFEAPLFGHSKGGGCGMSYTGQRKIGFASFDGSKIKFDGKIFATISLSDQWNMSLAREDLFSSEDELIEINFLTRQKDVLDDTWQKVELIEDWRSALAPFWKRSDNYKEEQNLHQYNRWTIPIEIFEEGKKGWVIGINTGSRLTENMEEHADAFTKYSERIEYKEEEDAYSKYYYKRGDDSSDASQQAQTNLKMS